MDNVTQAVEALRIKLFDFLCDEGILDPGNVAKEFVCPNPEHPDTDPSAYILPGGTKAYCHGCKSTFDIFHLNHWIHNVPLSGMGFIVNNLTGLCKKYDIPFEMGSLSEEDKFRFDSYRAYRMAYDFLKQELWPDNLVSYLNERGLTVEDAQFLDIFCCNDYDRLFAYLKPAFTHEFLRSIGFAKELMFSPTSIIFTIRDLGGAIVGFISRDSAYEEKKNQWEEAGKRGSPPRRYDSSPEKNRIYFKRSNLFGFDTCVEHGYEQIYIFEGQFDWALAKKYGFDNSIALSGSTLTPEHIVLLRKAGVRSIVLVLDGDKAGQEALHNLILGDGKEPGILSTASFLRVLVSSLPDGKDAAEYFLAGNYDLPTVSAFEWALNFMIEDDPLDVSETLFPLIVAEPNHLKRDVMIDELSEHTGLSKSAIIEELKRRENTIEAMMTQERKLIVDDLQRELKHGVADPGQLLRMALDKIDTLESSYNVDVLSVGETLEAIISQEENESSDQGVRGFRFSSLSHFQEMLDGDCKKVVVAIGGTANTGKCLKYDTPVLQADGSYLTIEEIYKNQSGSVVTLKDDYKLQKTKIAFYYDSGVIPTLRVGLANGLVSEPSLTHPYLTPTGWKQAKDLVAGDYVAVPSQYTCFDNLKSPLSRDELIVLACFLSKKAPTNKVGFTSNDEDLISLFKQSCSNLWPGVAFIQKGATCYVADPTLEFSPRVIDFCTKYGIFDCEPTNKKIPQDVFRCSLRDVGLFLSVFYSCEGWCSDKVLGMEVGISLVSKEMAIQLRHLLLRFGLYTRIRRLVNSYTYSDRQFDSWMIALRSRDLLEKFAYRIGFVVNVKNVMLSDILSTPGNSGGTYALYPVWELIEASLKKKGMTYNQACKIAFGSKKIWSENGWRVVPTYTPRKDFFNYISLLELGYVLEDQCLINLAKGDILFEKITSIEDGGLNQCYDLTVDKTHNFIANDIVVHNTAIMSSIGKEIVDCNDNTIALIHTIDDSREQFVRRLIVQWAREVALSEGLDKLAANMSINSVSNPSRFLAEKPEIFNGLDHCRTIAYQRLKSYIKEGRLYIKDSTHGATLSFLERLVKKVTASNPSSDVVAILDNFHKVKDFGHLDETQAFSERSGFLKTNIAQGYDITVFSTFEYNKVKTGDRPLNSNIRSSGKIEYDINFLINLFSHLKAATDQGGRDKCDLWHGSFLNKHPIIEGTIGKNKILEDFETRWFAFTPAQSRYECLSHSEVEIIKAQNRAEKAKSSGNNYYYNNGVKVEIGSEVTTAPQKKVSNIPF